MQDNNQKPRNPVLFVALLFHCLNFPPQISLPCQQLSQRDKYHNELYVYMNGHISVQNTW